MGSTSWGMMVNCHSIVRHICQTSKCQCSLVFTKFVAFTCLIRAILIVFCILGKENPEFWKIFGDVITDQAFVGFCVWCICYCQYEDILLFIGRGYCNELAENVVCGLIEVILVVSLIEVATPYSLHTELRLVQCSVPYRLCAVPQGAVCRGNWTNGKKKQFYGPLRHSLLWN